jgi:hypothetical protein
MSAMQQKKQAARSKALSRFVALVAILFLGLTIAGTVERRTARVVGCHYSPEFAQHLEESETWSKDFEKSNPQEIARAGGAMRAVRYVVRGLSAFLLAGVVVWLRTDSQ